jgi:hypothetical protein
MHAHQKVSPFLLAGHLRMDAMCEQRLRKPPLISCVHDAAAVAVEKFALCGAVARSARRYRYRVR